MPVQNEAGDDHHECTILQSICAMPLYDDTHMQHRNPHPTVVQLHVRSYYININNYNVVEAHCYVTDSKTDELLEPYT